MSDDYRRVAETLKKGADPAMLCQTCPWDRNCVSPPSMTADDIDSAMAAAQQQDDAERVKALASGKAPNLPARQLISLAVLAGRDQMANVCPVFAMRLRSSDGRRIVDRLKAEVQAIVRESE